MMGLDFAAGLALCLALFQGRGQRFLVRAQLSAAALASSAFRRFLEFIAFIGRGERGLNLRPLPPVIMSSAPICPILTI